MGFKKAPSRQIASAIDLLEQDYSSVVGGIRLAELPLNQIQPYHDHMFRCYTDNRKMDMVESIRQHGILNPIIVQRLGPDCYETLSGHNRIRCAEQAGLKTIPAFIKENLTETEALAYVIETNLIQRSFTDMLPSEQAAVLKVRYQELTTLSRQKDISRELHILETGEDIQCAPVEHPVKNRDKVASEYGLGHASVARLLRINYLIDAYKEQVDNGVLPIRAAVDLSYLSQEAQKWVFEAASALNIKLSMKNVKLFKDKRDELTRDMVYGLMQGALSESSPEIQYRRIKVPKTVVDQYLKDVSEEEAQSIVEQAIKEYFDSRAVVPSA